MNKRLSELQQWLRETGTDCLFINDPGNVVYFSGFESEPHERILGLVLFPFADPFLFTPSLEMEDAKKGSWPFDVISYLDNEDPWAIITNEMNQRAAQLKQLAIEKDFLTVMRHEKLAQSLEFSQFIDATPKIQEMKLIKSSDEIERMKEAGKWADTALTIGFNAIKEDVSEQEIVAEIEYQLKKQGIKEMSFETMVLAGDNAASPHGTSGSRKIKKDEFVLFDLGVVHNGYTSDVTRTIAFGTPSQKAQEIYALVLEAHHAAIAAVKPGVTAGELDAIARNIISEGGYGPYFTHRLGHGLGSSVHEYPSIMQGSNLVIQEGMCFSIEPGIYVPDIAGVRIEDCLYVTKDGCEVFTHTPTAYTSIL
ncbi:M24 family metallopeptidase [Carnobacterium antarcticum]|uniref:M24 family metallopeptidase n=1 Tax=Carnobacterium antarcticum TaxID=2126436 RepID=A0ABW4NPH0_9LACT|nr:Xaa-Pro peptidase family protein [Carnobacterium sp. CP1]ALV22917.1 Proline dipeptidase [Carnobacterium sp. CP1]